MLLSSPEGPRIYGLKITNLIDHVVKIIIKMVPSFMSSEFVKNSTCFGPKLNKIEQKEVPIWPT